MEKQTPESLRDQLNDLIASNQFPEIIQKLEELNQDLKSNNLENKVLQVKGRIESLQQLIIDGTAIQQTITTEENKLRTALTELKDLALDILENGESEVITPAPSLPNPTSNPATLIDYAIILLSCLVFLVLLGAFSYGLFTDPIKVGLIAFASAIMIGIILYLKKYRRDMGKSVFQPIKQN